MEKELEDRFEKIEKELKEINAKLGSVNFTDLDNCADAIYKNVDIVSKNIIEIAAEIVKVNDNVREIHSTTEFMLDKSTARILKAIQDDEKSE